MRIIAGNMRGRRLKTVEGLQTRPTSDKVKGAIFNVLANKVECAKVLDLFAGTGNLGLEALSRGATSAVFVEKSLTAWKVIRDNLVHFSETKSELFHMDAFDYLKSLHSEEQFDLIFLDPPYHQGLVQRVLQTLQFPCHLTSTGVIVIETAADEELPVQLDPFELRKVKEYGDTKIWYLQQR